MNESGGCLFVHLKNNSYDQYNLLQFVRVSLTHLEKQKNAH